MNSDRTTKISSLWRTTHSDDDIVLQNKLRCFGVELDINTGHLFYSCDFKPLTLSFELVFIRHGETFGNCGQSTEGGEIDIESVNNCVKDNTRRIFQGNVDTTINQLTAFGKRQASEAATILRTNLLEKGWIPDIILQSPLTRAKDTALPFVCQNGYHDRCFINDEIREMSFGSWDNLRVCDFSADHLCHTFYLEQNALVKNTEINRSDSQPIAENFCEVLLRANKVLLTLNDKYPNKRIVMFSHSMFGAACCILLGKGQQIENDTYLAFDGKRKDGTSYTMPHASPFLLNIEPLEKFTHKNNTIS